MIISPRPKQLTADEKEDWLDAARVPAMLLIILFHTGWDGATWQIFQPLLFFFFLSGYLTSAARFSYSRWWRRLIALAVPYILWNTLCIPGMADTPTWGRVYGIGPEGRYCADYPLWYLRALFLMMLVYPLFRKILWLPTGVACLFALHGNNWPCDWAAHVPLPNTVETFAFFAGCWGNRIPPQTFRRLLRIVGLPLMTLVIGHTVFSVLPQTLAEITGMFSLFSLAAWLPYQSRFCSILGEYSRATFLAFATHAGMIVLFQRTFPPSVNAPFFVYLQPFLFFAIAYVMLRLMESYCPRALPYLAHQGKLPWLYRRQKTTTHASK